MSPALPNPLPREWEGAAAARGAGRAGARKGYARWAAPAPRTPRPTRNRFYEYRSFFIVRAVVFPFLFFMFYFPKTINYV